MDVISLKGEQGDEKEGRWYDLNLEMNVPTESLLYNNGTDENPDWRPFEGMTGNEITVLLNKDANGSTTEKNQNSVRQSIANKWAIEENTDGTYKEDESKQWTVGVTITETEKSKTALHHEVSKTNNTADVWEKAVKDSLDNNELNNLNGIDIETIKEDDKRKSSTKNANYGTFAYTLDESKNIKITNTINPETDIDTATISLNSANVSDISLTHNNKKLEGRWILVHFAVRGDAKYIVSKTDSDGVIIDTTNRSELLSSIETSEKTDRIPLWINLDSEDIQKATKHKTNFCISIDFFLSHIYNEKRK